MATDPLLEAARSGDPERFRELVEPHLAQAYRVAILILLDRELARDAVQEALIRAHRGLRAVRHDTCFGAWFRRIVVNEARRQARRQWRQPAPLEALPEVEAAAEESPEARLLAREDRERVWTALAALGEAHRTVLILRYYQGLSDSELAEALAIPVGTVKSRLHKARLFLQRQLLTGKSENSWPNRLLHLLPRRNAE